MTKAARQIYSQKSFPGQIRPFNLHGECRLIISEKVE